MWFVSRSPEGPWEVADKVPGEIYDIPPSAPVYHTTYVYVYDTDPDWVTYGYLPGYYGSYYAWGVMAFGTGWYYAPYVYDDVYWPYAYTYGAGTWYNEHTGTYGRSAVAYGPYGGVGRAAAYNPTTGTYARGAAAYGAYQARALGRGLQPPDRHLRAHRPGQQRLRELGDHRGGAGRRLGPHGARQRQRGQRRGRPDLERGQRRRGAGRQQRVRRQGRRGLSPNRHRWLGPVRGRPVERGSLARRFGHRPEPQPRCRAPGLRRQPGEPVPGVAKQCRQRGAAGGRGRRHARRRRGAGGRSAMTSLIWVGWTWQRAVLAGALVAWLATGCFIRGDYYAGRSSGDLEACVPFNFDVSIEEGGRIVGVAATEHQWGATSWDVSGQVTGVDVVLETRTMDPRVPEPRVLRWRGRWQAILLEVTQEGSSGCSAPRSVSLHKK